MRRRSYSKPGTASSPGLAGGGVQGRRLQRKGAIGEGRRRFGGFEESRGFCGPAQLVKSGSGSWYRSDARGGKMRMGEPIADFLPI